jgi:hypothetical protein
VRELARQLQLLQAPSQRLTRSGCAGWYAVGKQGAYGAGGAGGSFPHIQVWTKGKGKETVEQRKGNPWKAQGSRKGKQKGFELGRWRSQDLREDAGAYRKTLVAYVDDSGPDADSRIELLHVFNTGQKVGGAKEPEEAAAAPSKSGGPLQKLERFVEDKHKRFVDKAEALVDRESSARKSQKRGAGSSPGSLRLVFPDETVWEKAEKIYRESEKRLPKSRRGEWEEDKRLLMSPQSGDDRELAGRYLLDIVKELAREWETKVSEVVESCQANGDLRDFLGSLREYLPERFNDEEGAFVDAAFRGCLTLRYVPPTRLLAADFVDLMRAYPDEFSGLGLAGAFYVQEESGGNKSLRERICAVVLQKVPACTLQYRCSDGQWSDCVLVHDFASRLGKNLSEDTVVQTAGIPGPMPFNSCREEFEGFGCPRLWMPEEGVTTPDERCRHVRAIIHSSRTGDLLRPKQRLAWAKACARESQIILAVDLLLAVGPLIDPVRLVDRRMLFELRVDAAASEWAIPTRSGQRLLHVAARHNRAYLVRGLLDLGHDPAARDHLGHVAAHYGCADELEGAANLDGQTTTGSSSCSQWSDPVSDPSELTAEDLVSPAAPRDKALRRDAFCDALKNYEQMTREEFSGETRFVLELKGLIYIADASRDYLIDIQPANRRDIWRKVVPLQKRLEWACMAQERAAKRLAKARARSAAE